MATYKSYTVQPDRTFVLQDYPVPELGKGELWIKVKAVALNPANWRYRDSFAPPGSSLGEDFAGVVVKAAEGSPVAEGERVAGILQGGIKAGHGAYSEYVKTGSTLVWRVPDSLDWEEAAALGGIGPHTAFQALCLRHGFLSPRVDNPTPEHGTPFLVWAASTSVGMYAVQIAKLAGCTVIATASPRNEALIKSLDAEAVYPYSDPSTPSKIAAAYPSLSLAVDCISEKGSILSIARSFANKAGTIVTLLLVDDGTLAKELPAVKYSFTFVFTLLGEYLEFAGTPYPVNAAEKAAFEEWLRQLPALVESGTLKINPLWRQEGGLARINDGLDLLRAGKASAQKLTYMF